MERIFKIKTKIDRLPHSQYPSERKYSATNVRGLSALFCLLFFLSLIMGTLIVSKLPVQGSSNTTTLRNETELGYNVTLDAVDSTLDIDISNYTSSIMSTNIQKYDKTDEDSHIIFKERENMQYNFLNSLYKPLVVCSGCYFMSLGYLFASVTGLLAWKRWYIDRNITLFFVASAISTVTTCIGFLASLLTLLSLNVDYDTYVYKTNNVSPVTFSLTLYVVILSLVGCLCSILSTKLAYAGMKSPYPDDLFSGQGRGSLETSKVKKGVINDIILADVLEHFPSGDKLSKYPPKTENGNLPKAESTLEYQQRVNRFLSEVPNAT